MFNARKILERFRSGTGTEQERSLIEKWWLYHRAGEPSRLPAADEKRILDEMDKRVRNHILSGRRRMFIRYAVAATALLAVVTALYFYAAPTAGVGDAAQFQVVDAAPGTNRATLMLSDGRTVELSTDHEGIIINNEEVRYSDGTGIVGPEVGMSVSPEESLLMSISTPKGGQYQVLLPDGTRVWLNADSRLSYPGRFEGTYREVEMEGEGYFQVAENNKQPFRINSSGQRIDVLGTEFNVAAYPDGSATTTTLVSGAVKVSTPEQVFTLRPGQQTVRTASGVRIQDIDISYVTAWKEGLFVFRQTDLKDVLMSLSRWYDVQVDTTDVADRKFNGRISRSVSLQQVLRMMEKSSDLKFTLNEERRIMVID